MLAVSILTTVATGLLGGVNLGTILARRGADTLPEAIWFRVHQAEDGVFSRVMPPFLITTIALGALAAVVATGPARWFYALSALCVVFDLVVTVVRLVPLNREIGSWTQEPPEGWRIVRDRWSRLHAVRGAAVILAFLFSVIALAEQ